MMYNALTYNALTNQITRMSAHGVDREHQHQPNRRSRQLSNRLLRSTLTCPPKVSLRVRGAASCVEHRHDSQK